MLNNYCPECQVLCSGKFCWRCGKRSVVAMVKCPYCGEEVAIVSKFCGNCGKPIQEAIKMHIERERGGEHANSDTGDKGD